LHRRRDLGRDPAPRRHAELEDHRRHQLGRELADLRDRRLRHRRRPVHRRSSADRSGGREEEGMSSANSRQGLAGFRRSRWFRLVWIIPALLAAFTLVVLLANWLRGLPAIADFIERYPGHDPLPESAP